MNTRTYQIYTGLLLYFLTSVAQAQTVFSDGNFSSGWADFSLTLDDPTISGSGPLTSTGSISTPISGGNPGAYRESTHNIDAGDVIITGGIYQGGVYDPGSSGAIASLDFSIDLFQDPTAFGMSGYSFALEQGGTRYYTTASDFFYPIWQPYQSLNLTAADFDTSPLVSLGVSNGQQPDFSSSGAPITFGYALGNTYVSGTGTLVSAHGADNWAVTVHAVPVPAALYLFASGLVGIVGVARKGSQSKPAT